MVLPLMVPQITGNGPSSTEDVGMYPPVIWTTTVELLETGLVSYTATGDPVVMASVPEMLTPLTDTLK